MSTERELAGEKRKLADAAEQPCKKQVLGPLTANATKEGSSKNEWTTSSWKTKKALQMPAFPVQGLGVVEARLQKLPPLVQPLEIRRLRGMLTEVQKGHRFLLQGGDCAERFADCEADTIARKMRILLQMSLVMSWSSGLPMLRVGRMAGQYAKPRSSDTEVVNGKTVPTFRGDCINGICVDDRDPNPDRLVEGYFHAAATLNYMRSCQDAGIADLHLAKYWELSTNSSQKSTERSTQYREISDQLLNTLRFMDSCHVSVDHSSNPATFFTSHEGLFLPLEVRFAFFCFLFLCFCCMAL